jgi:hypothetical protein
VVREPAHDPTGMQKKTSSLVLDQCSLNPLLRLAQPCACLEQRLIQTYECLWLFVNLPFSQLPAGAPGLVLASTTSL